MSQPTHSAGDSPSAAVRKPAPVKGTSSRDGAMLPLGAPAALFAADAQLVSPVPSPLDLLAYVPASTKSSYEISEDGFIVNPEDSNVRRTVRYANGDSIEVHIQGSQEIGLPTQEDVDFLLALFRLADQRRITPDGLVIKPSYRDILRAAGRRFCGTNEIAACKRALQRWSKVIITTRGQFEHTVRADAVRSDAHVPMAPDGSPRTFSTERTYSVLEYDIEREERISGDTRTEIDTINHLRINPVWLSQIDAGWLTWIDIDLHNSLTSNWAKRIYQTLAVRAALGWQPTVPYTASLGNFVEELGYNLQAHRQKNKVVKRIRDAFAELAEYGIIDGGTVTKGEGWTYNVAVRPGDTLLVAGLLRGVSSHDPATGRLLLAHLRAQGISLVDARAMIREKPFQVRNVLCQVYYLRKVQSGANAKKRITNTGAWIKKAVKEDWTFDDPEYVEWRDRLASAIADGTLNDPTVIEFTSIRRRAQLPAPSTTGAENPATKSLETGDDTTGQELAAPEFPDNIWGTVLQEIYDTVPTTTYCVWFEPTALVSVDDDVVTISARDEFMAEWLYKKHMADLAHRTARVLGRPIVLRCRSYEMLGDPTKSVAPTVSVRSGNE